jgi:BASS family bile acid:Na+ symporter
LLRRYITLWLVLSSAVAYWWPDVWGRVGVGDPTFDPFTRWTWSIPAAVVLTMFCIGCLLPPDEVRRVAVRWPTVLYGTLTQYLVMPSLAYLAVTLWGFTGEMRIGILLVGCVPGAMASNVLTMVARGNVSYSVGLTTSATLVSPLIVPLALKLTGGGQIPNERLLGIAIELVWMVVLPVVAGFVLCRLCRPFERLAARVAEPVANLSILWIIAAVVGRQRGLLASAGAGDLLASVGSALLFVNLAGYLLGYSSGLLARLPTAMNRALSIEVGMQNAGLGTSLAISVLGSDSAATVPTALYTFGCMLTGTLLAQAFAALGTPAGDGEPATLAAVEVETWTIVSLYSPLRFAPTERVCHAQAENPQGNAEAVQGDRDR